MGKPSRGKIIAAQRRRIDESDLGCDWDEAANRCWCCGLKRKTERAHMKPAALGGSDEPENFVLLCRACHDEAPDVDAEVMLDWLRAESSTLHGDRWTRKAMREWTRQHEIDDIAEACARISEDFSSFYGARTKKQRAAAFETTAFFDVLDGRVSNHSGQLSPATKVWAMTEYLERLGVGVRRKS